MRLRLLQLALLCPFFLSAASAAFALDSFDFETPRQQAMGGRHVALADDFSTLLVNPAGLTSLPRGFAIGRLGLRATGPVFDIADLFVGGTPTTDSILSFLSKNNYKLYAGVDLSGPLATGFSGNGLGFGIFNGTRGLANIGSVTSIKVEAEENVLLAGGYAVRADLGSGHELSAGLTAKGFVRGGIYQSYGIIDAMKIMSDPSTLLDGKFTLITGVGADAGLRWDWKGIFAAGLACRDLYSPAIVTSYSNIKGFVSDPATSKKSSTYDSLDRSLDLGLLWSPDMGGSGWIFDKLNVALDYRDILDLLSSVPRNPILNVGLGVEARILAIMTLRAGIDDALLSAGTSFDLGLLTLSVTASGTELGIDPGVRPVYNLTIDASFALK
jgi:hypothetical protein